MQHIHSPAESTAEETWKMDEHVVLHLGPALAGQHMDLQLQKALANLRPAHGMEGHHTEDRSSEASASL